MSVRFLNAAFEANLGPSSRFVLVALTDHANDEGRCYPSVARVCGGRAMNDAGKLALEFAGRWHGSYGCAPCPVCQSDRRRNRNALILLDGTDERLLLHCKKSGCSFTDFLAATGISPRSYSSPGLVRLSFELHRAGMDQVPAIEAHKAALEPMPKKKHLI